jgi:hypothetical protein
MTSLMASAPTEIRTPVLGLKGLRPSPLDDGGEQAGGFYHPLVCASMEFPHLSGKSLNMALLELGRRLV